MQTRRRQIWRSRPKRSRRRQQWLGGHRVVPEQDRLDLAEFDPEPTQLDLLVAPTQILKFAILPHPDQIARPVQLRAWRVAEPIGREALAGQRRHVPITNGDAVTADQQFANSALRNERIIAVNDIELGIGDRRTNQDRAIATRDPSG